MRTRVYVAFTAIAAIGLSTSARTAEDVLDRVDEMLSVSGWGGEVRARVSGTLDLEGYRFDQPAPALIEANGNGLFTPRLSMFLDAQIGPRIYVFAQARVDRDF